MQKPKKSKRSNGSADTYNKNDTDSINNLWNKIKGSVDDINP